MEGSVCVLMGKWGELTTIVGKSLGKRRLGAERGGVKHHRPQVNLLSKDLLKNAPPSLLPLIT